MKTYIQNKLNEIAVLIEMGPEFDLSVYQKFKSKNSSKIIADKLGLNEPMLVQFEQAVKQFYMYQTDAERSKIACFRLSLWLETVCKNLNLEFDLDETISNNELAIKQVRALELVIRDIVNEKLGGAGNTVSKLKELFESKAVDKWVKSADETGVLSGTTFSELSNIFLDKNIFKGFDEIFDESRLKLSKTSRDSLRLILDDIRLIRNAIAHNKKVSRVQIEALNVYYNAIADIIKKSKVGDVDPDRYLDLDKAQMESFLSGLKEDHQTLITDVKQIDSNVQEIHRDTRKVKKRTLLTVIGVFILLILSGTILFFVSKQSSSTDQIGSDIKDVKDIVSGDAELKNMSSTEDLSVTKDLNERTKDANAKRLAIIYFENTSGEKSLNKLQKGLAGMLISDLSNVNMLSIVERDKLEELLKEQKISNSKDFNSNTAAKIGKLTGAEIIMTGAYFEMFGSVRIDARFIDVETGEILKADGVDGSTSNFFKLEKQLAWKIIKNLDVKLSDNESEGLKKAESNNEISYEGALLYSEALDDIDNGRKSEAIEKLNKILKENKDFQAAKIELSKLK